MQVHHSKQQPSLGYQVWNFTSAILTTDHLLFDTRESSRSYDEPATSNEPVCNRISQLSADNRFKDGKSVSSEPISSLESYVIFLPPRFASQLNLSQQLLSHRALSSGPTVDHLKLPPKVTSFINEKAQLCQPDNIHVCNGSEQESKMLYKEMQRQGMVIPLKKFDNW